VKLGLLAARHAMPRRMENEVPRPSRPRVGGLERGMEHQQSQLYAGHGYEAVMLGTRPLQDRPGERGNAAPAAHVLQFRAVDPRQQVQIASLIRLAGPFSASRWIASQDGTPDALIIGLGTQEGRAAYVANRLDAMALPALLLGTLEQVRSCSVRDPASLLVLSPPFRHLSLYYCLDMLARQCTELRAARADTGERCLRLLSYPPAGVLKADVQNVRLASYLFAMPLSARELADAAHCDLATVQQFMHACDRLGLLSVASERRAAVPHRQRARAALAPRLAAALRRWLGL
jgi:hypothetical protein